MTQLPQQPCGCDTYPCDHTGCDCSDPFHNPGPGCPGQNVGKGGEFQPYTLTLRETRTGRYYVKRVPWIHFNGQWMQDPWHSERVSGWLDSQGHAVQFCMGWTFDNPGHVGGNKTPEDYGYAVA